MRLQQGEKIEETNFTIATKQPAFLVLICYYLTVSKKGEESSSRGAVNDIILRHHSSLLYVSKNR